MRPSNNQENKIPSDTYWRVQLALKRRGKIFLTLLRTLLTMRQESCESSFWEVIDLFVLLTWTSLEASWILVLQLLVFLIFTLDAVDLFCWYKQKKWLLWIMATVQAAKNHGDELGLMWFLR